MLPIENTMETFEKLAVQLMEKPTQDAKENLLQALEETFRGISSEINELKKRLISPEISYDSLIEKLIEICKNEPEYDGTNLLIHAGYESKHGSAGEEEYEYVNSRLSAVIGDVLKSLTEDTVWYLRENHVEDKSEGLSDSELVLSDLIKRILLSGEVYLREIESERGGLKTVNDLKDMVLKFSHDTKIDTETVHEWLSKSVNEDEPDRMTLAILYNMIESVVDEVPDENIKALAENDFSLEHTSDMEELRDVIITSLRAFLIDECSG